MHSFDLFFEDYFVPDAALVGGPEGDGRGFYMTMAGLSGGRVQTSARANGVMQAALDAAMRHAQSRKVFGQPIAAYPLTLARLARIAAWLTASRQLSYAVARRMDDGGGEMEASLVKLFACRAAEWVTRDAMQIHGGLGYAEETAREPLFRRRARAVDLRGRRGDPRAEGHRARTDRARLGGAATGRGRRASEAPGPEFPVQHLVCFGLPVGEVPRAAKHSAWIRSSGRRRRRAPRRRR